MNTVYSAQRFQPFRGGHAVPVAAATPGNGASAPPTLDARYGYTEQIAAPTGYSNQLGTQGIYYIGSTNNTSTPYYSTNPIYHTLGIANDQAETVGLLAVPRPRFHRRGRADARAGLPAGVVHQTIRRVRPVADQLGHLRPGPAAVGPARDHHRLSRPPRRRS